MMLLLLVAPHVGAWIEIQKRQQELARRQVAPHVGAWIEIEEMRPALLAAQSRTPRGCVD